MHTPIVEFSFPHFVNALSNAGYSFNIDDFRGSSYKYLGVKDGKFTFAVSMIDENSIDSETGETYYISLLYVTLNEKGLIVGEWSPMPIYDRKSESEVNAFFNGLALAKSYA